MQLTNRTRFLDCITNYSNIARNSQTIKTFLFLALCIICDVSWSISYNFETTRLKSTAGAGVASLLIDESTILNPAPMAFFNLGSFYIQRSDQKTSTTENGIKKLMDDSSHIGFIASDSKGKFKGSASYHKYEEDESQIKRWALAVSSPFGESSAIGLIYSSTKERKANKDSESTAFVFGLSHVLDESFSFGLTIQEPFKKGAKYYPTLLGMQYSYKRLITLMADVGGNYNLDFEGESIYKVAAQIKVFEDFFLRLGTNLDNMKKEKTNGIGIGWVQPKLSIDFAMKNTRSTNLSTENIQPTDIKENSFSLSYRF